MNTKYIGDKICLDIYIQRTIFMGILRLSRTIEEGNRVILNDSKLMARHKASA